MLKRARGGQQSHSFFPGDLTVTAERHHAADIRHILTSESGRNLDFTCEARLLPEPDNPADPNAVAVIVHGRRVGYIAAAAAPRVRESIGDDEVILKCIIRWNGEVENGIYRVKVFPTI